MLQAKKKVIIFITKSNWGGAQKYVFDIATSLPWDEFEVVVALGGKDTLHTKLVEKGIRTISLDGLQRNVSLTKDIAVFQNILSILKQEKPDIVHVNSSKIGAIGALAGRIAGVWNIVFTVHGWAFNENRSFLSKTVIKLIYLLTLWLSHKVIIVSQTAAAQVRFWPFDKKKLTVIHNGIRVPRFLDRSTARKALGEIIGTPIDEGTVLVGGIGEYHYIKGQTYGIQAIEKITRENQDLGIKYLIIGNGEIEQDLRDEIVSRKLEDKVFLTGYLEDGATYISGLDYYLFPSLSESLGYAAIEAGFAKLPVVASNVGGIPEIIGNGEEGTLVPAKDANALADALLAYINNPELRDKHAEALYEKVGREFTLETMTRKTVAIYRG